MQTQAMMCGVSAPLKPCVLSYRRVGGSDFAQLLKVCFQKVGIDVFLDVDNLGQGQFDEQLWKRINAAKNVVLVWTKGCECHCVV